VRRGGPGVAGQLVSPAANVQDVGQRHEILVESDEWNVQDPGGRRDEQVHRAATRLESSRHAQAGEHAPLACDLGIDRYRVEFGFDESEPAETARSFARIACEQEAKMEFSKS